jgi:adenylosuccinate synthase
LALTKVDVLSGLDQIKIAVAYEIRGERTTEFPSALADLEAAQPIYESFSGWSEDISNVRGYDELPQTLRDYIRTIEELTGVPVTWVSNGPGRDAVICR